MSANEFAQGRVTASWLKLLRDEASLLRHPGAHHKRLLNGAHALHRAHLIGRDDLTDLLEQADGALAYAIEALLGEPSDQ